MKLGKVIAALVFGACLVGGCLAGPGAMAATNGVDNLYADLNHDGRVERVNFVKYDVPSDAGRAPYMFARIVVFNDKGKVLWRGPSVTKASQIDWNDKRVLQLHDGIMGNRTIFAFLYDLDGDGCIELCVDDILANAPGFYNILRWKNGKFVNTGIYRFSQVGEDEFVLSNQESTTFRYPDLGPGQCRYNIHAIHKSNGKLIGTFWKDGNFKKAEFVVKDGVIKASKYL